MSCYSKDELNRFLLQELAAERQIRIDEHVRSCDTCCGTLKVLSNDDLVQDYYESARRDDLGEDETSRVGIDRTGTAGATVDWQPFATEGAQLPLNFGRFVLTEVLGSGGFGVVYRADDAELGREVAIKIPHLAGLSPAARRRFVQEGTAAARLHHPHIVQLYQSGTQRGVCFLVSEYCPGETLRQMLNESLGGRPARQAARIVLPLAEAVAHAHVNGIVHRDIKPANVVLDNRGAVDGLPFIPKLTDFGTAKFVETNASQTASGMLIGTAPYMAPEQVVGNGQVGPPADVYALGVLLYELIAGRSPIEGADNADTIHRVLTAEPTELHRLVPGTPRDISAICSRCLEKAPERRYASARQLAADLRRFLEHEPTLARPLGPTRRAWRWCRRNPMPVTVMTMVSLLLVSIAAGLVWHTARLESVNDRLRTATATALSQQKRAEQSELHTRQLLYVADMRLAEKSWRDGDLGSARQILNSYVPSGAEDADLRGPGWYFLDHAIRPETKLVADDGSPLYCIRLAPDGATFAVAGQDGMIRVHDRVTGALRQTIESGQIEVNSVAFSPDGTTLASAGDDGSIAVWRLADGICLAQFAAHEGLAFGVEFTPDGERLISCGSDDQVHAWDAASRQRLATYNDHGSRVEALAVSPDGRWLASVGKLGTLAVRDLGSGELHWRWTDASGTLSSVAFSPDSGTVAVVQAAGPSKWLRLFELASRTQRMVWPHRDGIRAVAYSPDGTRLLTADNAGVVRIWDMAATASEPDAAVKPLRRCQVHDSRVYSAVFEPQGVSIVSAGADGQVRRWNVRDAANEIVVHRRDLRRLSQKGEEYFGMRDIAFQPHTEAVVIAMHAGIDWLSVDVGKPIEIVRDVGVTTWNCIAMPRHGDWLFAGRSTIPTATEEGIRAPGFIERLELRGGLQGKTTEAAAPSQPQDYLTRREVIYEADANCEILRLRCDSSGDLVAVTLHEQRVDDRPKQLLLLDSKTGKSLRTFPAASGTNPCFTPDDRVLIFGVMRDIHAIDLRSGQERVLREAHRSTQNGMAISHDGRWLATSDDGRVIKLWRLPGLEEHAVLYGHLGAISALTFSPDSRALLSSSHDGTVKAWHVATGQQLFTLHDASVGITDMALSSDGRRVAIVEDYRQLRILSLGSLVR